MIELESKDLLTWAGMAIGLMGVWYRNQYKVERLTERDTDQDKKLSDHIMESMRQHEAFWKWKELHEKESTTMREFLNKEIAELRAAIFISGEQFKQILKISEEIKSRIEEIGKSH